MLEGRNVEEREVDSPDPVGIFDSKPEVERKEETTDESRTARDLRWRGCIWSWWSREFTTHDTMNYRLCQLQL